MLMNFISRSCPDAATKQSARVRFLLLKWMLSGSSKDAHLLKEKRSYGGSANTRTAFVLPPLMSELQHLATVSRKRQTHRSKCVVLLGVCEVTEQ